MTTYAVVQERFERIAPEILEAVLLRHGELTRPDAARVVKQEQGILWERFSRAQAEGVAQALAQQGALVRVVPADRLPKLGKPRTILWLEMSDEQLTIPVAGQQALSVDWSCVFVISSGQVGQLVTKLERKSNPAEVYIRRSAPRIELERKRESRRISVTDIVAVADSGKYLHVRLPAHGLAFGRILPPSDQVTSAFQKYLEIVRQLVARSTAALVSPRTRELLAEGREDKSLAPRNAAWASLDDLAFERYNRWLLQLVIFREQQGERGESSSG